MSDVKLYSVWYRTPSQEEYERTVICDEEDAARIQVALDAKTGVGNVLEWWPEDNKPLDADAAIDFFSTIKENGDED